MADGQLHRGHPAERHADDDTSGGSVVRDGDGDIVGEVHRAVGAIGAPARVAVARQVDGEDGSAQGEGDRVPRVGVLRAAVHEHHLHRVGAPSERADLPRRTRRGIVTIGHGGGDSAYRRQLGHHEPELLDVLVEQTELVVGAHGFTMTRTMTIRQCVAARSRCGSSARVGCAGQGAGASGEGATVVVVAVVVVAAGGEVVAVGAVVGGAVVDGGVVVVVVVLVVVVE